MKPEEFVALIQSIGPELTVFRLATIDPAYSSGQPRVQFDGDVVPGERTWPRLSGYTPAANDRVLIAMVNHGGVILGKIV
jgi:hypothetical protein